VGEDGLVLGTVPTASLYLSKSPQYYLLANRAYYPRYSAPPAKIGARIFNLPGHTKLNICHICRLNYCVTLSRNTAMKSSFIKGIVFLTNSLFSELLIFIIKLNDYNLNQFKPQV
jgi:hypothetical protein